MLEAPNAERDAARLQASAAQWEYDDEYDDSFDDLATHGNEGIADAEGVQAGCLASEALMMPHPMTNVFLTQSVHTALTMHWWCYACHEGTRSGVH